MKIAYTKLEDLLEEAQSQGVGELRVDLMERSVPTKHSPLVKFLVRVTADFGGKIAECAILVGQDWEIWREKLAEIGKKSEARVEEVREELRGRGFRVLRGVLMDEDEMIEVI